ncbi:hypothetical protein [Streptomyces sp. NPDC046712]|uniref:hypothetical protein n=1 Tax=Streptomyces sp. NPDC046712 TaxID=3154802 RepID=UPI0033F239CD
MEKRELRAGAEVLLAGAASRSKRSGNVPFPPAFVIAATREGTPAPLARMIQGGQGGEVRLRLYLCITMMASGKPYDLKPPPTSKSWAALLALDSRTGERRVTRNLKWLADNGFIRLERRWGGGPHAITLLSATGDGSDYVRPIEQGRYVGVPVEFWTQGWILELSPTAAALLLVLLEALGGHDEARYITTERRHRYGLSSDTWTKATKELAGHGLLTVGREPQGSFYDHQRLRNTYWLDVERLKKPPVTPKG